MSSAETRTAAVEGHAPERHVLELDGLCCGYGSRVVVSGLNARFESGQTLCLLGPNGVGKTTLFKTLLGFLPPMGGRVLCDGEDMSTWQRKRFGTMFGYIPQKHVAAFDFTVFEMVLMGRTPNLQGITGHVTAEDNEIAESALAQLGIGHLRDRECSQLSGGEMQMVLIARAIAQQPAFLVMDEPTSALDLSNQVRVLERVRTLGEQGFGVIMTTHDPNQAFLLDGEVLCMGLDGRYVRGLSCEVLTSEAIAGLYGVSVGLAQVESPHGTKRTACAPFLGEDVA